MTRLPGYFEYLKEHDREPSGMFSFYYDHSTQEFSVANARISISNFDPYAYTVRNFGVDEEDSLTIDVLQSQALVLPALCGPIVGPKLHEWARKC